MDKGLLLRWFVECAHMDACICGYSAFLFPRIDFLRLLWIFFPGRPDIIFFFSFSFLLFCFFFFLFLLTIQKFLVAKVYFVGRHDCDLFGNSFRDAAADKRTRTKSKERQHTRFERNISRLTVRTDVLNQRKDSCLFCHVKIGEGWRSWPRRFRREGEGTGYLYL